MLKLNNLKSPGSNRDTKRLGRGPASGQGGQAGKGHKGQKARSGGFVRIGFEGGAIPLYMKLPKRGFKNMPFKVEFAEVSLCKIEKSFTSEVVSRESLISKGLLKGEDRRRSIKILANGKLTKALTFVKIDKFTKNAVDAIAKAGGKIE